VTDQSKDNTATPDVDARDATEEAAEAQPASLWTPRKLTVQVIGFLIGAALLAWCIHNAVKGGDWSRLWNANPWLIAAIIGCTSVNMVINGTIFWAVIYPVQPLKWKDLQLVNFVTSLLNYAPIRLGLISRVAYHIRVDRMPLLHMGGWFTAFFFTLLLCLGATTVATLLRPSFDWLWWLLLIGQVVLGGLLLQAMMSQRVFIKYGRGMHLMLTHPMALWGTIGLRMIDIAAVTGRMACAVAIMQVGLSGSDVVLLAIAAVALSLNPLGRFGFREAGVAIVAERLTADVSTSIIEGHFAQLALIESAGEAIVFIPVGALALIWYRHKWVKAGRDNAETPKRRNADSQT